MCARGVLGAKAVPGVVFQFLLKRCHSGHGVIDSFSAFEHELWIAVRHDRIGVVREFLPCKVGYLLDRPTSGEDSGEDSEVTTSSSTGGEGA